MKNLPRKKNELALNKQAMTERLAEMRKALGPNAPAKDTRVLHMLCSVTARPFAVTLTRESAAEKYRIERFDAGNGNDRGACGASCAAPDAKPQDFPIGEFDFSGFACPHCGHRSPGGTASFFRCGCGKLQCGGRIRVVGNVRYATCHDGCGKTGPLGSPMKSVAGEQDAKKEVRKTIAPPSGLKRLFGPGRK